MVQAIAIYQFEAAEDNELSILKNEILDVVDKSDDWWTVKNKYGQSGLVPVAYIAAPIPDSNTEILARARTVKGHKANSENELTVKKGEQVAIFDKSDDYWWFVGLMGQTGFIPKRILNELKVMYVLCYKTD
jgi:NCK adaptor protein